MVSHGQTPEDPLPDWRGGLEAFEWTKITGSNVAAAETAAWVAATLSGYGPPSTMFSYSGMCIDTRDSTVYFGPGGGHQSYSGNPAWKLALSNDLPVVRQVTPPSAAALHNKDAKLYDDGRPCAAHSYWGWQFIESRNRAMRFGSFSTAGDSGGTLFPNIVSLDYTEADYEADGTYTDMPFTPTELEPSTCKDPTTENVYVWSRGQMARWNQAAATWTTIFSSGPFAKSGPIAVDSNRNRLFYVEGIQPRGGSSPPTTMDLTTNTFTDRTLTGDLAGDIVDNGWGMVYDPSTDRFYLRDGRDTGGTVYRINPETFAVDTLTTSGGDDIPATASVNCWNRFLYVPQYKGIIYVPKYDEDFWFLALEAM